MGQRSAQHPLQRPLLLGRYRIHVSRDRRFRPRPKAPRGSSAWNHVHNQTNHSPLHRPPRSLAAGSDLSTPQQRFVVLRSPLLPLLPSYSLPRPGFRAGEGREAPTPERSGFRWRLRNPRAIFCRPGQPAIRWQDRTRTVSRRILPSIVATIGTDFRAKRCALTLDEPLQMMSPKDSFYKNFASGQSRVPVVQPHLS